MAAEGMSAGVDGRLACGASLERLVDQVAEAAPPADGEHQAGCVHCRAALRELERVWADVRALADHRVVVPARVLEDVRRRIRGPRPRAGGTGLPLDRVVPRLLRHARLDTTRGVTRVADAVLVDLARVALVGVPGVVAARGRAVEVEVEGHRVRVRVRVLAAYGPSLPELAERVRRAAAGIIERRAGLEVVGVDVVVEDVVASDD
jgi:uncharacterized alkaline shock family protein YloU